MLLYTVAPFDEIFPPQPVETPRTELVDGGFIELVRSKGGFTVSRVISTDPAMYIKKGLAPGDAFQPKTSSEETNPITAAGLPNVGN